MKTCSNCSHYSENRHKKEYDYSNRCLNSLVEYTYGEAKPKTVLVIEPEEGLMDATKSNYPKEWDAGISARYEGCELGTGVPTEYSKDQKHAWRAGWLSTIANGASISDEIREAYERGFDDGVKSINAMEML